jgi:hypothetical protein
MILLTVVPSNQHTGALIWTDRGCGTVYTVYDPIIIYFTPYTGYEFEVWSFHNGQAQLVSAGIGDGHTYYREGTIGPPAGEITFVLSMSCYYECAYCGMCDYGECTIFVDEYICDCPNRCYGDDLWAMTCVNGICVKDYIVEKNSAQCGYDPCKDVACTTACNGYDLWTQKCVDGKCVDDRLLEANSISCGYDPCTGIVCRDVCKGYDLWSQKCEGGTCVDDQLIESDSVTCGYDPCENHCTNGVQDCSEYGVDCGGGCPFTDSDNDGVEDCIDLCGNSRCNKVDAQGCEVDVDGDGVLDCEDDCPGEQGDASNRGCPGSTNLVLILGGIGALAAVGGGLALWGMRGGNPPTPKMGQVSRAPGAEQVPRSGRAISRPLSEEIAARQEAAERIARETAEEVARRKAGTEIAGEASKKAGAKLAGEASKKAGTKLAEEASKKAGTKLAETAAGVGVSGLVAKKQMKVKCPNCGEKMPADSKFCSKCGHKI